MNHQDIASQRLCNQHLAAPAFEKPDEVVAWLGAVQAQDYHAALWAVGLRLRQATEAVVEHALADRTIVRTWPMRGTLHFVASADVRWMLALLTPRVLARSQGRYRQLGLDEATFTRSRRLLAEALQGGKQRTRDDLYRVLEAGGVATADQRGYHILFHLAHEGLVCFGPRQGKQQTFVLLDEWVPAARTLERDEALAELARRYFTSHGPATVHDLAWWSGLTVTETCAGLEMAKPHLLQEVVDDQAYWLSPSARTVPDALATPYLLPVYDEYTVAYKDRRAVLDPADAEQAMHGIFSPIIVVEGRVAGTWKRRLKKDAVVVTPRFLRDLSRSEMEALTAATARYGAFLGREATLDLEAV